MFQDFKKTRLQMCDPDYQAKSLTLLDSILRKLKHSEYGIVFLLQEFTERKDSLFSNMLPLDGLILTSEECFLDKILKTIRKTIRIESEIDTLLLPEAEISSSVTEYKENNYSIMISDGFLLYSFDIAMLLLSFEESLNENDESKLNLESFVRGFKKNIFSYKEDEEYNSFLKSSDIDSLDTYSVIKLLVYFNEIISFTFAHELSHIFHNHLRSKKVPVKMEDEADINALYIVRSKFDSGFESINSIINDRSNIMPLAFYLFMDLIDSSNYTDSHDSSVNRMLRLSDIIYSEYGKLEYSKAMMQIIALTERFGEILSADYLKSYFQSRFDSSYNPNNLPKDINLEGYFRNIDLLGNEKLDIFVDIDINSDIDADGFLYLKEIRKDIIKSIYLIISGSIDDGHLLLQDSYKRSKSFRNIKFMFLTSLILNTVVVLLGKEIPAKEVIDFENSIPDSTYFTKSYTRMRALYVNKVIPKIVVLLHFTIPQLESKQDISAFIFERVFNNIPETLTISSFKY